mmetsp:Transcript_87383/g.182863  ORF Transcript_87383/g.182863 Transcript_87383/m.182863 type:complete len:331 (-) Transcript_87383:302-1294(-)|eukprot:CAMPEP_0206427234 /NCGR_PEP_ID=MMETSP0324_2-20121206/4903_1 /ASSEMBLY_ACC=CAM_ASM_000836 /TAXON_ID=2866 /ORGANISM="Crypthecodinium cohnii, Strain Seligo" /LENGTH=330 /DNA_ID=CAMNT_0053892443 /DNA_START=89 /DNA_END=1081 /DNA_ORIENTATION=-
MDHPEDELGLYVITHQEAVVKQEVSIASRVVAQLGAGEHILILEFQYLPESHRLRARIASPPGWLSLRETRSNYSWARLLEPISETRAKLISDIIDRERQLGKLQSRAARLKAETVLHLNNFADRIKELEARILDAKIVPVDAPAPSPALRTQDPDRFHHHLEVHKYMHAKKREEEEAQSAKQPVGYKVIDTMEVDLDPVMRRVLAVHPPPPPKPHPKDAPGQPVEAGNIVTSNAPYMPSINYPGVRPHGIYPVTRTPGLEQDRSLIDQIYAPLPTPDHYTMDMPGAWRYTEASRCPLVAKKVEMVADPYCRGHVHQSITYVSAPPTSTK